MLQNAAGVFKEDKDLPGLMAATASVYETSAHVLGAGKVAADPRRVVNISDQWARVEVGLPNKVPVHGMHIVCQPQTFTRQGALILCASLCKQGVDGWTGRGSLNVSSI